MTWKDSLKVDGTDLISRKALLEELGESLQAVKGGTKWMMGTQQGLENAFVMVKEAPAVDAIPIDNVAEMLAGMYGDCCPCNYLDIDEGISVDCKRKNCPGIFETDYSCWKKYVEYWMKRKMDGGNNGAST